MSQSPRSLARLSYQKCEVQFKDLQVLFKFVVHFFLGPGRLCGATANQSARILKTNKESTLPSPRRFALVSTVRSEIERRKEGSKSDFFIVSN